MRSFALKAGLASTLIALSLTGAFAGGEPLSILKNRDRERPLTPIFTTSESVKANQPAVYNTPFNQAMHWHEGWND